MLSVPATIQGVKTMSGRALRITLDTQELLSDEVMAKIAALHEKYGWFAFMVEKPIEAEDLVKLPPLPTQEEKISLSQRQRNIIYRLWESKGKPNDDFQGFYIRTMTKLNEYLKEQIV